jgi:hypothetical protein
MDIEATTPSPSASIHPSRRRASKPRSAQPLTQRWITELGDEVARRWDLAGRKDESFAALAADALAAASRARAIDPDEVLAAVDPSTELPRQLDLEGRFSDLPLTVYAHERFCIQMLFWLDGVPSIHDHDFVGAFQLVSGASIHTTYEFHEERTFGPLLGQGTLRAYEVTVLHPGATRRIDLGRDFIHGLFHLERPSVSLVVRTYLSSPNRIRQYEPSGLSWCPLDATPALTRTLQALKLRHALSPSLYRAAARTALARADEHGVARILLQARELAQDEAEIPRALASVAARRHPALVRALEPVLEDVIAARRVLAGRQRVHDSELRFAMAVLLSSPNRRAALEVVAEQRPRAAPEDTLVQWAGALMAYAEPGSGLEDARLLREDGDFAAFRAMLEGHSDARVAEETADFGAPLDRAAVARLRRALQECVLFRSIVTE